MSTDNVGYNYDYPEASYERRREILKEHEAYQKGWLYFIANDPRVPREVQERMRRYGLPKDEFQDYGGWPHQIYVREARRMVGQFVMTEHELLQKRPTPNPVGMGSYTIDSHNVQRYVTPDGCVQNEGDIGVGLKAPYAIAYGALVPRKEEAENLFVPVCVSSSHIAFGSIRMEPVFMILAQSAATAAAIALDRGLAVQDVPYEFLRERLLKDGQVLSMRPRVEPAPTRNLRWTMVRRQSCVEAWLSTPTYYGSDPFCGSSRAVASPQPAAISGQAAILANDPVAGDQVAMQFWPFALATARWAVGCPIRRASSS
jgi:hypothetical protein